MVTNIWTHMTPTAKRHMKAICDGEVTKSNIIGLRKALNAQARKDRGYSVSRTSPNVTAKEVRDLVSAIERNQPRVVGDLHDSGVKLLRNAVKRYRRRYTEAQRAAMEAVTYFRFIGFVWIDDAHCVPAYRVFSAAGPEREGYAKDQPRPQFAFYTVPWQSAVYTGQATGPQILP